MLICEYNWGNGNNDISILQNMLIATSFDYAWFYARYGSESHSSTTKWLNGRDVTVKSVACIY